METIAPNLVSCSQCKTDLIEHQKFCTSCGYPELGTEAEQSKFHADRVMNKRNEREASNRVRSARNTLFIIAALTFVVGIFYYFQMAQDIAILITYAIIALIYMVLGFWSQKKPLVALILGLLVYLTVIVISAIVEPLSLVKGIIMKVIVIAYLIKGINSASKVKR